MAKVLRMTQRELNRATLARQMLILRESATPRAAIERLAGLQAQEARPPFLGLWSRVEGFDAQALRRAIQKRQIVRVTAMRGTLHLMTVKDYLAFRGPLQDSLARGMRSVLRGRSDGFSIEQSVALTAKFLGDGAATMDDIRAHLVKRHPKADERAMGYAVRTHLPMVQVPDAESDWCYPRVPQFACAESWLGKSIDLADTDVTKIVKRYLAAFGPATSADAQTWSGIPGLAPVLEAMRGKFQVIEDTEGRELFDLPRAPRPPARTKAPVRLLPEFDNLVLAHADRTRLIAEEHRKKICTANLRVLPTFLVDGVAAGLWKVERTKTKATLTFRAFDKLSQAVQRELTAEGEAMLAFSDAALAKHEVRFGKA